MLSPKVLRKRKVAVESHSSPTRIKLKQDVCTITPVRCCSSPTCCFSNMSKSSKLRRALIMSDLQSADVSCNKENIFAGSSTCAKVKAILRAKLDIIRKKNQQNAGLSETPSQRNVNRSNLKLPCLTPFGSPSLRDIAHSTPMRQSGRNLSHCDASVLETSPIPKLANDDEGKRLPQASFIASNSTPLRNETLPKFLPISPIGASKKVSSIIYCDAVEETNAEENIMHKLSFDHWLQKETVEKTLLCSMTSKLASNSQENTINLCCSAHSDEKLSHHSIIAYDEEEVRDGEVDGDTEFIVQEHHVLSGLHESLERHSLDYTIVDELIRSNIVDKTLCSQKDDYRLVDSSKEQPEESHNLVQLTAELETEYDAYIELLPAIDILKQIHDIPLPPEPTFEIIDLVESPVKTGSIIMPNSDAVVEPDIPELPWEPQKCDVKDVEALIKPDISLIDWPRIPLSVISIPTESKKREPFKSSDPRENRDIEHPDWEKVRKLSTDEERYEQVRECWNMKTIPDPNKDLTYYSFRKQNAHLDNFRIPHHDRHKRQASENIDKREPKRLRTKSVPCTETIDLKIKSVKRKKEEAEKKIRSRFHDEMRVLIREQWQQEQNLNSAHQNVRQGYNFQPFYDSYISAMNTMSRTVLEHQHESQKANMKERFSQEIVCMTRCYNTEMDLLVEVKKEIDKFCNFYSGLETDSDPTILTATQLQEIEEIENVYNQFNLHYYDPNV